MTVAAVLLIGISFHGSTTAMFGISLFALTIAITYTVLLNAPKIRRSIISFADILAVPERLRSSGVWLVCLAAITIALVHFIAFHGMTLGASLTAKNNIEVALIRQGIIENLPTTMQYLNAIAVKTLFPIGILLAVTRKMRFLTVSTTAIGLFYALCMMQKAGAVVLSLPVMTYFLLTRRWVGLASYAIATIGVVFFMGIIANPQLQSASMHTALQSAGEKIPNNAKPATEPSPEIETEQKPTGAAPLSSAESATFILAKALLFRVAITPGDVAAKWFDSVPNDVPFGRGCGYRFLTPFLDCEFQNYSTILYDKFYPEHRALGMRGTVNSASMMTAYANFGMIGIALSGVLHGLLAWGLFVIFQRTPELSPAFNIIYLLLLSSGDLFTILFSGGWGLSILLYMLTCRPRTCTSAVEIINHVQHDFAYQLK